MAIAIDNKENPRLTQYLSERKWVMIFAISIMIITTLPYFLGYWVEKTDPQHAWRFSGFIFGVEDGNSYIAKALTGTFGAWLFRTPYTVFPQNGVIAFLPYLLFGKLVSAPGTHEQLVALFHIFRFFAGILSVLATYDFIKCFINDEKVCKQGLVIATLGGGIGWIMLLFGKSAILGSLPLEFYSPEAFGFLGLYGLPHMAMARAFMFWGILWHFKISAETNTINYRSCFKIGIIWLFVALLQPLAAFIMGMVLGLHLVIITAPKILFLKKPIGSGMGEVVIRIKIFLLELIPPLPFFIYYVIAYSSDEFLKTWSAQNTITSPHPVHYLIAYGLLLPLVIVGIIWSINQKRIDTNVLVGWFILAMVFAYAPVSIQRRLIEGIWVVLVVLMLIGYQWIEKNRPALNLGWCLPLITILVIPSTLILLTGGIIAALKPSEPLFRPTPEIASFQFLGSYVQPDDIVLASYETGNALPAWAPVRVLVGHGPESADYANFIKKVDTFYDLNSSDADRLALIDKYAVRFVYWGTHERALGNWDPAQASWLTQIFNFNGYAIFEVIKQ